ncbi:hypothetical protein GQ42DRAFT_65235, partial [Ramicandelaber brevisporus]
MTCALLYGFVDCGTANHPRENAASSFDAACNSAHSRASTANSDVMSLANRPTDPGIDFRSCCCSTVAGFALDATFGVRVSSSISANGSGTSAASSEMSLHRILAGSYRMLPRRWDIRRRCLAELLAAVACWE